MRKPIKADAKKMVLANHKLDNEGKLVDWKERGKRGRKRGKEQERGGREQGRKEKNLSINNACLPYIQLNRNAILHDQVVRKVIFKT